MIIDFRVRPPYKSYLEAVMFKNLPRSKGFSQRLGMPQAPSVAELSLEKMLLEMCEAGITKAVIPGRMANPAFGRVKNEDIQELLEQHPEIFIGFAGIDPSEKNALQTIEQLVVNGPFQGIVMEPGVLERPIYADDAGIYPIYEYCQQKQIPVNLMVGGNAGPDISYSMPAAVDHIAVAFPALKIVIAHGGWPWCQQMIHLAMRRTNVYLSPDMYMVHTPGWQDYVTAANYTIPDRFLFGTAYPFVPFKEGVQYFKSIGIREENLDRLMYQNAAELLGLKI